MADFESRCRPCLGEGRGSTLSPPPRAGPGPATSAAGVRSRSAPRGPTRLPQRGWAELQLPRRTGEILRSRSQDRARAGDHPGSAAGMHVPGPLPPARSRRCEAGPGLRCFRKTSQVILTQALHGNPQRILGAMGLPGPSERRDSGGSARESGQGSARRVRQRRRLSRGRPGAGGKRLAAREPAEDTCLHLPPGAGAVLTRPPSPQDRLRGGAPQPVLTGAEAMGGVVGSRLRPAGGTGGREGMGWEGGPCGARNRLPRAAAPPGHYNNGGPVKPRAPGLASRAPRLRRRGRVGPPPAGRRDAPPLSPRPGGREVSGAPTLQSQRSLTPALPAAGRWKESSNWDGKETQGWERGMSL